MQQETQVTTIVQQIDAQGPVVVERITTQLGDLACTPDNARKLVEALHSGSSVTLEANGKIATFSPSVNLGYGETYIALALAAEALRQAGVTGCATPEQWQAVLMGGPLTAAGTTTTATTRSASASSSSSFPGILALRSQGQGWGQIAHTTNIQLGQVVSSANSSFKFNADAKSENLTPTGRSSSDFNRPPSSSSDNKDNKASSDPANMNKPTSRDPDRDQSDKTDHDTDGKGKHGNTGDEPAKPSSDAASTTSPRGNGR